MNVRGLCCRPKEETELNNRERRSDATGLNRKANKPIDRAVVLLNGVRILLCGGEL